MSINLLYCEAFQGSSLSLEGNTRIASLFEILPCSLLHHFQIIVIRQYLYHSAPHYPRYGHNRCNSVTNTVSISIWKLLVLNTHLHLVPRDKNAWQKFLHFPNTTSQLTHIHIVTTYNSKTT